MTSYSLPMQASSLQFSDTPAQQRSDIEKLFRMGKQWPIKTGTEAGPAGGENSGENRTFLKQVAQRHDHALHFARDNWIAVDRAIIRKGTIERGEVFVADRDDMVGHGHDRVMCTVAFEHFNPGIGRINIGAVHYPTKGAKPGSPNYDINVKYSRKIGEWMEEVAQGADLAFVNGDFNMNDKTLDWAMGQKFTSMADELKAWENTGHGPIDGFCSYDGDGRVSAKKFEVLDDKEFKMFSDHFLCRGVWSIRDIKEKK